MAAPLVFITFLLLVCASVWVALKYGTVTAYIGFAWLIPLAGIIWWTFEYKIFGSSGLNLPFVLTFIIVSLLAVLCFPVLIVLYWHHLSGLRRAGLMVSAFLHGIPFLMFLLMLLFPPR